MGQVDPDADLLAVFPDQVFMFELPFTGGAVITHQIMGGDDFLVVLTMTGTRSSAPAATALAS